MTNQQFQQLLAQKGEELYRDMPWRDDTRPYYVLVSELMLQQTQVDRVRPKFAAFVARFPDEKSLASASLADVLILWQGLGYNRRAKFLHEAAKMIVNEFDGTFPDSEADLLKLPGVGKNTAGAIRAYAFNQPSIFVETNIRTVIIHHFFNDRFDVEDTEIIAILEQLVPGYEQGKEQPDKFSHKFDGHGEKTAGLSYEPKAFYQALMDYGSWLKSQGVRNISSSKHYKKQPALKGSLRETRGAILRQLSRQQQTKAELERAVAMPDRFDTALADLQAEGMVDMSGNVLHLTK